DAWTETAQGLVQALLAGEEVQVVDARSAAAYEGGHVRGALSLPAASLVDEAFGAARLWPEIIAAVAQAGVDPERPTVVYAADPRTPRTSCGRCGPRGSPTSSSWPAA